MAHVTFIDLPVPSLHQLAELCKEREWNVGFAESCTGGLLSAWLVSLPSVSKIFQGAVVCYGQDVKVKLLDVPRAMIQSHGEVSQPVARAMARGAKKALPATWAVSITGIAGPTGGSKQKPVGTVCFGVCGPGFEESKIKFFDSKLTRQEIQRQAALFALGFLLDAMK